MPFDIFSARRLSNRIIHQWSMLMHLPTQLVVYKLSLLNIYWQLCHFFHIFNSHTLEYCWCTVLWIFLSCETIIIKIYCYTTVWAYTVSIRYQGISRYWVKCQVSMFIKACTCNVIHDICESLSVSAKNNLSWSNLDFKFRQLMLTIQIPLWFDWLVTTIFDNITATTVILFWLGITSVRTFLNGRRMDKKSLSRWFSSKINP